MRDIQGELKRERKSIAEGTAGALVQWREEIERQLREEFEQAIGGLREELGRLRSEITVGVENGLRQLVIERFSRLEERIAALAETDRRLSSFGALSAVH